tara:strand:+ start:311 stop:634 length:324 start_codon:yes stop_codon:yes gene_type:complete
MNDNENWVKTYSIHDIDDEDVKEFHLPNGNKIAVYNINSSFYATDLFCTHEEVSLCDGFIDGDSIECPLHQGVFKISTGEVLESPPTEGLKTYLTKIENNFIYVNIN